MLYQNLFKEFHAAILQVTLALNSALNLFLGYVFAKESPWDVTGMLKMTGAEQMRIHAQTPVSCMPRFMLLYVPTYRKISDLADTNAFCPLGHGPTQTRSFVDK